VSCRRLGQVSRLWISLASFIAWQFCVGQAAPSAGTTSFVLDGNRMYAELGFVRQDGSIHRALAYVDMGTPSMTINESLLNELHVNDQRPLMFRVGTLPVEVAADQVQSQRREPRSMGSELKVEGILAGSILQKYLVVIDYRKRRLTLAKSGTMKPRGLQIPFHINERTGLIAVDASIDGSRYAITIDNGSAYTWFRQSASKQWLTLHPAWNRGVGAVGPSNMMMSGDPTETAGILLRIPEIDIGSLVLRNVGVLAAGPGRSPIPNLDLFDWYSQKNAVPVIGWIGGNVLKRFQLTVDYPNRMTYWLQQRNPEIDELDQVGLTLRAEGGEFFVAAVATKNSKPTVEGVLPGDKLLRVGDLETRSGTWGAIYDAMHGKPGDIRLLLLERGGKQFTIAARVTKF
jgi:hypothetical protein